MAELQFSSWSKFEADLWEAADNLRANSKLTSTEYCMPVLGVIFLRHAANRFDAATRQIQEDQTAGRMAKRRITKHDYIQRRALWLPEKARYEHLIATHDDRSDVIIEAMNAIEEDFPPLQGVLPKEYTIFEPVVLEDLLRLFDSEALRTASGDLFGRIYEYFLMKFAMQGAQDNGEFFTPPSLVQTIVNVIEPDHGIVLDPATGSGGMFVQSSHFVERLGKDAGHHLTFYGQEKTATTIRLAKMNLAVHGLEGDIREANTFYEDVHTLVGKCDFVMANPPFNVDMVDAEKVKDDIRLPFGLPGVNKNKKVSNGNYLWISYFHSYLNDKGRAGFVMSSQASSAGHGEKEVRRKIVEAGEVDVMIAIRSNFFYTRSVPCELWFFDRGKPKDRSGKVLMIDARNIYRKVTRKIYDFSPEQQANLASIVWLYRGQKPRFLNLVKDYFETVCRECEIIPAAVEAFDETTTAILNGLTDFDTAIDGLKKLDAAHVTAFRDALAELRETRQTYDTDRLRLLKDFAAFRKGPCKTPPATNDKQHTARKAFELIAERIRGLGKQIDLLYKLAARTVDAAAELAADEQAAEHLERRRTSKCRVLALFFSNTVHAQISCQLC